MGHWGAGIVPSCNGLTNTDGILVACGGHEVYEWEPRCDEFNKRLTEFRPLVGGIV